MNKVFSWNAANVRHIAKHAVTAVEAEYVVRNAGKGFPRKIGNGKWLVKGQAESGRFLQVIFIYPSDDEVDVDSLETMTTKKSKKNKPFTQMTVNELAEATKEFDLREIPDDATEVMTPEESAEWSNGKRGRGRPRKGLGAVNVLISFERGLLDRADAFARGHGVGRSALVAEALERLIGAKPTLRRPRASA